MAVGGQNEGVNRASKPGMTNDPQVSVEWLGERPLRGWVVAGARGLSARGDDPKMGPSHRVKPRRPEGLKDFWRSVSRLPPAPVRMAGFAHPRAPPGSLYQTSQRWTSEAG